MRTILKKTIIIILSLTLVWLILINSHTVRGNVSLAFDLWIKRAMPALFPMFVIGNILISFGMANFFHKIFNRLSSFLFRVNGTSFYVILMSLVSGTPSNAVLIKELYEQRLLTTKEANKILAFTFFANPLFIYSFLLLILEAHQSLILKVILTCYLGNILIGVLFRNSYKTEMSDIPLNRESNFDFSASFTEAIKKSMNVMIIILGVITFFIIISSLFLDIFNLSPILKSLVQGTLEFVQGLNSLTYLNIDLKTKAILSGIFISFGSLSIHTQIKSILVDTPISYKLFLLARIIHCVITALVLWLII